MIDTNYLTSVRLHALILSLLAGHFAACGHGGHGTCDSEGLARDLAGPGNVNCGRVGIGGDPTAVDQCVSKAFSNGVAFYARYDLQGIDSSVSRLLSGTATGRVFFLLWDSDPSGGGGAHESVDQWECISPTKGAAARQFDCASAGPSARVCY
jgi:hypothetical protein